MFRYPFLIKMKIIFLKLRGSDLIKVFNEKYDIKFEKSEIAWYHLVMLHD